MVDPIKSLFPSDFDEIKSVKENSRPIENVATNSKTTKSFSLEKVGVTAIEVDKVVPSPMYMIKDQQEQKGATSLISSEELDTGVLSNQIAQLKGSFSDLALNIENTSQVFDDKDTHQVLQVMHLLDQDLSEIANNTNQQDGQHLEDESKTFVHKALNWCYSGEQILHNALLFLSEQKDSFSSLGDYLKLQYAVQRATQRTELFASLMGITISSIKTIMTTQLG